MPCSFQEIKNVKLLTHYNGQRQFAIDHLRDSGDLKSAKNLGEHLQQYVGIPMEPPQKMKKIGDNL